VHGRADHAPRAISDGGPEVVLAIRLVGAGNAIGDNRKTFVLTDPTETRTGRRRELSPTDVEVNAHPTDYLAHSESNTKIERPGRCTAARDQRGTAGLREPPSY
jgi:hypothetical protein